MSCPTCDHTMTAIGCRVSDRDFFWCPRCGTIKTCEAEEAVVPDLVRRCRKFIDTAGTAFALIPSLHEQWQWVGIKESINIPENRPK